MELNGTSVPWALIAVALLYAENSLWQCVSRVMARFPFLFETFEF